MGKNRTLEIIKTEIERRIDILSKVSVEEAKKGNFDMSHYYHGKDVALEELLSFLSTLESEKPMNPDDAMKELDEKIALVKRRGTWDGVDVDKYMDEVRGREPEKPCHTVEEWMEHIKNADALTKAIFSKGPYNVLYDALNRPYRDCYDAIKEFGELCYQTARQDMMKEAEETELYWDGDFLAIDLNMAALGYSERDKVRIIIVKED